MPGLQSIVHSHNQHGLFLRLQVGDLLGGRDAHSTIIHCFLQFWNAQKFEQAFYTKPNLRNSHPPKEKQDVDVSALIEQLKNSPEPANALAALISEQEKNG